jgi:Anti-sigma factor
MDDALSETLALYVFGLLEAGESAALDDHIAKGCQVCAGEVRAFQETAAALPQALESIQPPAHLRERVLASIQPPPGLEQPLPGIFVSKQGGAWKPTPLRGVSSKTLYADPETGMVTSLLRMEPGASYPAHHHVGVEQCLVLEGTVRLGDIALESGDFEFATVGTNHGVVQTDTGCILLLVANPHDKILR